MKPILYQAGETDFNHKGLGILAETIACEVTEERNGEFELTMEYPVSGLHYAEIQDLCLIKAKPNSVDDPHVFMIYERKLDTISQVVSIYATSISNGLGGNLVTSVVLADVSPQTALDVMKNSLVEPTDFMFYSNINTMNDVSWSMRNPLNCIAGEQGSLLDVFGGEVKRGNSFIWLYARRGRDNVTTIRHGKNLSGLEVEYSTKGLVTKILPYFTQTPEGSELEETIMGSLVVSQYAANYPITNIIAVDYSSDERVTDLATLNSVASSYFTEHTGVDRPSLTMDVKLDDLSDSSEYAQFKYLENIELCDTVTVYAKRFDVNITAKVTKLVYDVLREKNQSLEVGSRRTSFYDTVKDGYKDLVKDVTVTLNNTIEKAANGKNRVFRGVDEPTTGMVKNDVWYKPVGAGEIKMYVFDGSYWQKEAYSADSLGGTVNFANINAINLNLNALTTASITGLNMWLNLLTGEMQFTNAETGDILGFDQAKIMFQNGSNIRYFKYNEEGWVLEPGDGNIGTAGNTGLILKGKDGAHKYIDGINTSYPDREHHQRVTMINDVIRMHSWGGVEIRDNEFFDGRDVYNYIRAKAFLMGGSGANGMYEDDNGWNIIQGANGVSLHAGEQEILAAYAGSPNEVDIFGNVDLNGGTILNQSDVRLKSNVIDSIVDPFTIVEKMRFIEFEWDKTNPYNKDKPEGAQFGQEAQYAPFLAVQDNGSNYLSLNMGKQVNLNSMTNQKLIKELKETKKELSDLKEILKTKGVIE